MSAQALRVERIDGLARLESSADLLAACNASSAMPSPFAEPRLLLAYAGHDEYFPGASMRVRAFLARETRVGCPPDDDPVIGYLVLRHALDRVAGPLQEGRLDFVATHDTDEPGIVAVAGREREVAEAIVRHLIECERDWSVFEIPGQYESALLRCVARSLAGPHLRVREVPVDPYATLALQWPTLGAYFADLSKRMRSNLSRQARKLYAAGEVELFVGRGDAVGPLFEAHLELEDRSWKHGTDAGLGRSTERTEYFRALSTGSAGVEPRYTGVALDGVLIAGLLNATFGDSTWSLDMTYDATHSELGPGQLPLLLTIGDAIGHHRRSVHFLQFFNYFKERWLADSHPAVVLQVLRRPSLWDTRAMAGDLRVRMGGRTGTIEPVLQKAKREGSPSMVDEASSRALLDAARSEVCVLDALAAARILPFSIEATSGGN